MGVHEMNICEMQETDGGIIWFVVIAACVLLSGCSLHSIVDVGNNNVSGQGASTDTKVDSTSNVNTLDVH
jgi:hypothetical protein